MNDYGCPELPQNCVPEHAWQLGVDAGRHLFGPSQVGAAGAWDRAFRVPGFASIPVSTDGAARTFRWNFPGTVVGIRPTPLASASEDLYREGMTSLGLKLTVGGGQQEVFANDSNGDFLVLGALTGFFNYPENFQRVIQKNEIWTVQFHNYSTTTAFIPEMTMLFRSPPFMTINGAIAQLIPNGDPTNRAY
jgi:hypothetical protein